MELMVLDLYNFEKVTVENNNILVNTTTGENGAGTAYPIQATGPYSGLVINSNNLTSLSRGPALGIYSQNYDGITDIIVTNNNIDVTGYATSNMHLFQAWNFRTAPLRYITIPFTPEAFQHMTMQMHCME